MGFGGCESTGLKHDGIAGIAARGSLLVGVVVGFMAMGLVRTVSARVQDGLLPLELELEITDHRTAEALDSVPRWGYWSDDESFIRGDGLCAALYGPSVLRSDIDSLSEILGFSADEAAAALQIYQQRLANYLDKARPMREAGRELTAAMVRSVLGGEGPQAASWMKFEASKRGVAAEQRTMRRGVMEDLRALLTPSQEALWPKAELAARRMQVSRICAALDRPYMPVDVRTLVDRTLRAQPRLKTQEPPAAQEPLAPEVAASIDDILAQSDVDTDAIFQTVCRVADELQEWMLKNSDSPKTTEMQWTKWTQIHVGVEKLRQGNVRVLSQIGAMVPESRATALWEGYQREAFPRTYVQMHAERTLAAALRLPTLAAAQRAELLRMQADFAISLGAARRRSTDAEVEATDAQTEVLLAKGEAAEANALQRLNRATAKGWPGAELQLLDRAMVKQVRGMLSAPQRTELPKRPRPVLPVAAEETGAWR